MLGEDGGFWGRESGTFLMQWCYLGLKLCHSGVAFGFVVLFGDGCFTNDFRGLQKNDLVILEGLLGFWGLLETAEADGIIFGSRRFQAISGI